MEPVVQFRHRPGILDLSWGHPRPELLPVGPWAEAGARAARDFGWQALTYGHATGPGPLLEWLTAHLADGTTPDRTFVTGGASHGLALITAVLAGPGDVVLVDSPTYHLAFRILADRGVRLVRAPADEDGIDPAALADLLVTLRAAGARVPLLYLVPTFGNPTGRSLAAERRQALVALARRADLTLVEDDTYRELWYARPAPPSLWQIAGGRSVVRLGSFAKTVAPGLRLGWINAEPAVIERLAALGYVDSGGGVNHATAMTMAVFGAGGGYAAHVAGLRDRYREQRDALLAAVPAELRPAAPAGGWFLWLTLPAGRNADQLLPVAERHGTSFVPGARFYLDGHGGDQRLRLSFSHLPVAELMEAGRRLSEAL
jgi:2-aminoadipate transaminase